MKIKKRRKKLSTTKAPELHTHLRLPKILRPKWTDTIRFPDDLTEIGAANITELIGKYTQLWGLVNQDACRITQELLRYDAAEQDRINEILEHRPGVNRLEKYKKDGVFGADPKIAHYRRARKALHIQRAAVEMYLQTYDKYINALSRELTRKSTLESIGPRYASSR
jgi:hypothetical protein